jgi:hypothetical protein
MAPDGAKKRELPGILHCHHSRGCLQTEKVTNANEVVARKRTATSERK